MPQLKRRKIYLEITVDMFTIDNGNPITMEKAKKFLGWREAKAGDLTTLTDIFGNKIVCMNNDRNRPFDRIHALKLAQDILNKHWRFNRENIIIGETGLILSGQHRFIGLIFACQMWEKEKLWKKNWQTEPVLESLIAFGGDEDPLTIRTLDNVKTRSYADVLFTENYFGEMKASYRKTLCSMTDWAVRTLWERLRIYEDCYSSNRTHSEGMDFLDRHPRLIECVSYIFQEDVQNGISQYVPPGTSAAMLYLMASSGSDTETYHKSDLKNEKQINWHYWDKACEFWVALYLASKNQGPLRAINSTKRIITGLSSRTGLVFSQESRGSVEERVYVIVKTWNLFCKDQKITGKDLNAVYSKCDTEYMLPDDGTCEGVDLGPKDRAVIKNITEDNEQQEEETNAEDQE